MKILFASFLALLIAGCGSKPDCGSSDGEKLIVSLINENGLLNNLYQSSFMMKHLDDDDATRAKEGEKADKNIKNAKLKLEDVVTLSKNDKTGATTCRARLNIFVKDLVETKATVYYMLETTSKGDLYGTITNLTD